MPIFVAIAVWLASAAMSGCRSRPAAEAAGDEPVAADLVAAHNARVTKLDQLQSSGQLDLTWVDDDGEHFEFVNIHLIIDPPRRTALRVEKIEDWMWLGSDDERYWFFDMRNQDEKVLFVGRFDDQRIEEEIPGLPHPLRLLDLAGITPLPEDAQAVFDESRKRWAMEGMGQGGRMRVFFEENLRPDRIESFGAGGELLFSSTLSRYGTIELPGQPPGAYPYFPRQIEIREGAAGESGSAKLTLDSPTGIVEESRLRVAFDLDQLRERLRPHRVEDLANDE
jgi:hypothetical protein